MKLLNILVALFGFLIIAGTAGASDNNLDMSLTQIVVQMIIGIIVLCIGIYNAK
jgi:uncharacterized membrane protein YiaA